MASDLTPPPSPVAVSPGRVTDLLKDEIQCLGVVTQIVNPHYTRSSLVTPPPSPRDKSKDRTSASSRAHDQVTAWLEILAEGKEVDFATTGLQTPPHTPPSKQFESPPSSLKSQPHNAFFTPSPSVQGSEVELSNLESTTKKTDYDLKDFTRNACIHCHTSGLRCVFPAKYHLALSYPPASNADLCCLRCKRNDKCCILRQPLSHILAVSLSSAKDVGAIEWEGEVYYHEGMEKDKLLETVQKLREVKDGTWRWALPKIEGCQVEGVRKRWVGRWKSVGVELA